MGSSQQGADESCVDSTAVEMSREAWENTVADLEAAVADSPEHPDHAQWVADLDRARKELVKLKQPPSLAELVAADPKIEAEFAREVDAFRPDAATYSAERDPYAVMDLHEEEQIIDEIAGRTLDVMVYSFKDGEGRPQTGLSYAGVREIVRTINARSGAVRLRVSNQPPIVEEFTEDGEAYYRVKVYAEDAATGGGQWAAAVEPKHMTYRVKSGPEKGTTKKKWDKFALTKALNKAQRNALGALIPETLRQMVIALYLKDERRVKAIKVGGGGALAELPAPLTSPEAVGLLGEIDGLYGEIKEHSRTVMPPGAFNARRMRAAHDLGALRALRDSLGQLRDELKEKAS
jgi:hypothetical protein